MKTKTTKQSKTRTTTKSSFIKAIKYEKRQLMIRFKNGNLYFYNGVPSDIAARFVESKSKGSFYNRHIKGQYSVKSGR